MTGWRITPYGDAALLIEAGRELDAVLNARVLGLADTIRAWAVPGVRDVVPAFASLIVHLDPSNVHLETLAARIEGATRERPVAGEGRQHEVPVCYEPPFALDLAAIADVTGLTPDDVVSRHAAREYRVFMLGFLPGFPYMGVVDEALVLPRRASPRLAVPAGSVGIAGPQTGIYPAESPGGWHVLGRTPLRLFDAAAAAPARFAPGDRVRFVPVTAARFAVLARGEGAGAAEGDL